jgi:hypothetical protein
MPLLSHGILGGVLLVCLDRCAVVLSHLKAIFMSVCLKMLVIFLILGEE